MRKIKNWLFGKRLTLFDVAVLAIALPFVIQELGWFWFAALFSVWLVVQLVFEDE